LYDELNCTTLVNAADKGDELGGVLLTNRNGEEGKYRSFGKTACIKRFGCMHVSVPGTQGFGAVWAERRDSGFRHLF
jgi:hypothetical protein